MLSSKVLERAELTQWQKKYDSGLPFKHVVIDDFLDLSAAKSLSKNFPSIGEMKTKYNGLNEKKAEHSSFKSLSPDFERLKKELFSPTLIKLVQKISGVESLLVIDDRFGYGLHQGGNGSFLDIHIDYNLHPLKKKQRRLNLLIFLTEQWEELEGGILQFWNADVTKCITSIKPKFNRCVIFECTALSYHGYDQIHCSPEITRKSFYTYFFSEAQDNLQFHDTMFKTLPTDKSWKKILVAGKEEIKNFIKRTLYKVNMLKVFK